MKTDLIKCKDKDLIDRILNPSTKEKAFRELLKYMHEPIYFHLRKMLGNHEDSADATQNTFIQVNSSLSSFKGASKLSTWIYTIATRKGIDLIKKRKYFLSIEDTEQSLLSDSYFDGNEAQIKLLAAILTLPAKQRAVFVLKYFEDLDYKSISEATGTSIGALKASFHHAKEKIKPLINS